MIPFARTLVAVCGTVLFASAAVAQQQRMHDESCRADVERLCKDVPMGQGRIAKCLKDNESSVSAACKEHLAQMRERGKQRMEAFVQGCKSDIDQYCKDTARGQGKLVGCLREHSASLSASCKDQLAQIDERHKHMQQRMHGIGEACKGDVDQYCQGVQPGGGRIAQCLRSNKDKLSEACKSALSAK
jgi:Golgi apparatus protein 1